MTYGAIALVSAATSLTDRIVVYECVVVGDVATGRLRGGHSQEHDPELVAGVEPGWGGDDQISPSLDTHAEAEAEAKKGNESQMPKKVHFQEQPRIFWRNRHHTRVCRVRHVCCRGMYGAKPETVSLTIVMTAGDKIEAVHQRACGRRFLTHRGAGGLDSKSVGGSNGRVIRAVLGPRGD